MAEKVAADKAAKEAARAAERERKAMEAAEAKRYPIDDLELLGEQSAKAATAGALPEQFTYLPESWGITQRAIHLQGGLPDCHGPGSLLDRFRGDGVSGMHDQGHCRLML